MNNQLNMFELEVSRFPKREAVEITRVQFELLLHTLREYKTNLEAMDTENVRVNMSLRKADELLEYMEDAINGGKKKNCAIRKNVMDVAMDAFDLAGTRKKKEGEEN